MLIGACGLMALASIQLLSHLGGALVRVGTQETKVSTLQRYPGLRCVQYSIVRKESPKRGEEARRLRASLPKTGSTAETPFLGVIILDNFGNSRG